MAIEKENTLQQIAENALIDSIVCLNIEKETPCLALRPKFDLIKIESNNGSGFYIEKNLIVTNFHVIIGATSAKIKQSGSEETLQIQSVEAYDEKNDLILLTVDGEGVPLRLGDSDKIKEKDEICEVGFPDDNATIEHGTVENIWKRSSGDLIGLSTKSAGGGSGSPILNSNGEVIGVKSSVGIDESGNVVCGYAIPSNRLKRFLQERTESVPFEEWHETANVRYIAEIDAAEKFCTDGDFKEGIAHYDIAVELCPDKKEAIEGRASAKFELAFFNEALSDHISMHKSHFIPFRFSNIRESISWRWGMLIYYGFRFLLNVFVSVTGRNFWLKGNANSYLRKAKSAKDEGKNREVRRYYKNAINLFSEAIDLKEETGITYNSRAWVRYLLGQLEYEQGNTEEAIYSYQYAIDDIDAAFKLNLTISRVRAACYHTRGVAKAGLGDHQEAIEDFNECIRLRPKKALYYQDRGISRQALGQQGTAKVDFAKAKEIDPDIGK